MNRSARKKQHELARRKHRQELQEHAREAARKKPSMLAFWILSIGLVLAVVLVVVTSFL